MTIKEKISYHTDDGVGHSSIEAAAAHERRIAVRNHLIAHAAALKLGPFSAQSMDVMARVICETQEAVAKIFAVDRVSGVAPPADRWMPPILPKARKNPDQPLDPDVSEYLDEVRARAAHHGDTVEEILAEDAPRREALRKARTEGSAFPEIEGLADALDEAVSRLD